MRPREPRRKVLIDARLRHEHGWADARILNISRRGLMARAAQVPPRGAYVEISKGTYRIVARVVWVSRDCFGARTQDAIAVEAMANDKDAPRPPTANINNDRRLCLREPDREERRDRSRRLSRGLEFVAVTLFGCSAAYLALDAVRDALSKPLNLVEATLAAPR